MQKSNRKKILIFGASNVAIQLAKLILEHSDYLKLEGFFIRQDKAIEQISSFFPNEKFEYFFSIEEIKKDCDFYILAVSDNALDDIISSLPSSDAMVLHTAGSYDLSKLSRSTKRSGVLYPLQSISKNRLLEASDIPIFLEVANDEDREALESFAKTIFPKVYWANSSEREKLHLAAVFSANFSNYLYSIAYDIAKIEGFDPSALIPLIKNVANRLEVSRPDKNQTGPAERKDFITIKKHLSLLNKYKKDYSLIYKTMSDAIIRRNTKDYD